MASASVSQPLKLTPATSGFVLAAAGEMNAAAVAQTQHVDEAGDRVAPGLVQFHAVDLRKGDAIAFVRDESQQIGDFQ